MTCSVRADAPTGVLHAFSEIPAQLSPGSGSLQDKAHEGIEKENALLQRVYELAVAQLCDDGSSFGVSSVQMSNQQRT
jgi:hypothetical protein